MHDENGNVQRTSSLLLPGRCLEEERAEQERRQRPPRPKSKRRRIGAEDDVDSREAERQVRLRTSIRPDAAYVLELLHIQGPMTRDAIWEHTWRVAEGGGGGYDKEDGKETMMRILEQTLETLQNEGRIWMTMSSAFEILG